MIFQQFYLGCLAHASYFIADETTRIAAVVDPRRDIDIYLEEAARIGAEIRHVILTHWARRHAPSTRLFRCATATPSS